jgi:hypothetical protein
VGLAAVTLAKSGESYEHIAFSTKPWRDVTEFKMVRAMWEDYRRGEKVCMKTIEHFSDFAEFFERMKSLPDGSEKYLRRKDKTGLQRLRRDICRAYKHGEAGFPKVPQHSAREFAEILNSTSMQNHGIKTEVADVENGKRTGFKPHTSPPTKEVLRVLRELKGHFPELDVPAMVGTVSPDQVMLSAALRTECQFIDRLAEMQCEGVP